MRIFNTYGPRMHPDDGRVVSNFIVQALCVAVSAHPGESMRFLAEKLGERPSQLTAIVSRLKRANRIRTVGARQFTRYFPSTETARAATS